MKQLNIPFELGLHYENWEFDLEVEQDRLQGCESYIYIGKGFNKILNYSIDKTELIFSLDILQAVVITVTNSNRVFRDLSKIVTSELNSLFETSRNNELNISRFVDETEEVWIVEKATVVYLIVTDCRYSLQLIKTLL